MLAVEQQDPILAHGLEIGHRGIGQDRRERLASGAEDVDQQDRLRLRADDLLGIGEAGAGQAYLVGGVAASGAGEQILRVNPRPALTMGRPA